MKHRVLIVDDEPIIRAHVTALLEEEHYQAMEADSASALRRLFKGPAPDVVLLDLKLPDGDGLTLIPELKKAWPEAKIAILTGYGNREVAVEAFKRKAVYLQCKPFDSDELKTLLKAALMVKSKLKKKPRRGKTTAKKG
jgi:DNA-binding NtrC family response regulator